MEFIDSSVSFYTIFCEHCTTTNNKRRRNLERNEVTFTRSYPFYCFFLCKTVNSLTLRYLNNLATVDLDQHIKHSIIERNRLSVLNLFHCPGEVRDDLLMKKAKSASLYLSRKRIMNKRGMLKKNEDNCDKQSIRSN